MAAHLEVTALLDITLNGSKIALTGAGTTLRADLPNLRTAIFLKRLLNSSLSSVHTVLCSRGLALDLRLRNAAIGCIGYGARPTLMGRLAGCAGVELHFFRTVWALAISVLRSERAFN